MKTLTRKDYLERITDLWKKLNRMYVEATGTNIQERIGIHISEADLTIDMQDYINDEGIGKIYDRLVENYFAILRINDRKHYCEFKTE